MSSNLLETSCCASFLFIPLVEVFGAGVCIWYRSLSKWLMLVMLGLLGQAIFHVLLILSPMLVGGATTGRDAAGLALLAMLCSTLMVALTVSGLTMTLADVKQRLRKLREAVGKLRGQVTLPSANERWQPRKEGSRDIQQ
jgi:hypothetical protein